MSLWKKIEKALQYAEHAEFLAKLVAPTLVSLFGGKVLSIFVARYGDLSTDWKTAIWLLASGLLFYLYVWVRSKLTRRLPETPKLVIHRAVYGAGPQAELLVTDKIKNMLRDALVIPVDNNLVPTDPAWGVRKRLDVEYSYGSDTVLRVSRQEPLSGEISRLLLPEDTELPRLKDDIARLTQQVADLAALSQDDPLCKELKAIAESDARKITERVRHSTKRIDFDYSLASDSHLDVIIELLNMSVFEITSSGRIDGHTRYGGQQLYGNPEAHNEPDLPGPTFVRMEHGEYGTIRIRQFLSPQVAEQMWINKGRGIAIDMSFVGVAFRTHLDGMPDHEFRIFGPRFTMDDVVRT